MKYFSTRGGDDLLSFEEVNHLLFSHLSLPSLNSTPGDSSNRQSLQVLHPMVDFTSPNTFLSFRRIGNPNGKIALSQICPSKFSHFTSLLKRSPAKNYEAWWKSRTKLSDTLILHLWRNSTTKRLCWSCSTGLLLPSRTSHFSYLGIFSSFSFFAGMGGRGKERNQKGWLWLGLLVAILEGKFSHLNNCSLVSMLFCDTL